MEKNQTEITKMKTQSLKLKTQWISWMTECTEEGINELEDRYEEITYKEVQRNRKIIQKRD